MNVTTEKLVERAKAFGEKHGVPIAKNAFEGTVDDPVPSLPYLVYLLPHETGRGADGLNNLKAKDIDFELYTAGDNQEREDLAAALETEILMDVEYEMFLAPIQDEECYQTAYEVKGLLTKTKGANKA